MLYAPSDNLLYFINETCATSELPPLQRLSDHAALPSGYCTGHARAVGSGLARALASGLVSCESK